MNFAMACYLLIQLDNNVHHISWPVLLVLRREAKDFEEA
jgi:hypothetical protein